MGGHHLSHSQGRESEIQRFAHQSFPKHALTRCSHVQKALQGLWAEATQAPPSFQGDGGSGKASVGRRSGRGALATPTPATSVCTPCSTGCLKPRVRHNGEKGSRGSPKIAMGHQSIASACKWPIHQRVHKGWIPLLKVDCVGPLRITAGAQGSKSPTLPERTTATPF